MQAQKGFTLIELISVIVILGILAAVALPKFVNLSAEARVAKMQGAVGSVNSAAALIHAKWLAAGSPTAATPTIDYEGGSLVPSTDMTFGYPNADKIAAIAGLSSTDFDSTTTAGTIADAKKANCKFTYAPPATSGGVPTVVSTDITAANCG